MSSTIDLSAVPSQESVTSRLGRLYGFPSVEVLGLRVDALTVPQLHASIQHLIETDTKSLILHVNVHAANLAYTRPWLRQLFNSAAIVFCDGQGIVIGAKLMGQHIPERITYADWTWQLAAFAEEQSHQEQGYTFYFLGARPGVAEQAAAKLQELYPRTQIVGFQHGYFDKTPHSPENQAVITEINRLKPDILVVGFGMPLQEQWLLENWNKLDATITLTAGAMFDYISGNLRRPPRWLTTNGFEWLGRLAIEPQRLWQRYVVGNPLFFWRLFKHKLRG